MLIDEMFYEHVSALRSLEWKRFHKNAHNHSFLRVTVLNKEN